MDAAEISQMWDSLYDFYSLLPAHAVEDRRKVREALDVMGIYLEWAMRGINRLPERKRSLAREKPL